MKTLFNKKALVAAPPALGAISAPAADDAFRYMAAIANTATDWLIVFALLFAVIMIVLSGIKLMFAGSDEEKRGNAKRSFMYALVGVVVVILAKSFVVVIQNFFTGQ